MRAPPGVGVAAELAAGREEVGDAARAGELDDALADDAERVLSHVKGFEMRPREGVSQAGGGRAVEALSCWLQLSGLRNARCSGGARVCAFCELCC